MTTEPSSDESSAMEIASPGSGATNSGARAFQRTVITSTLEPVIADDAFRFRRLESAEPFRQSFSSATTGAWSEGVSSPFFFRHSRSISTDRKRATTAGVPSSMSIRKPCLRWKAPPR